MNSMHIAACALEWWRAQPSRERTLAHLDSSVTSYGESYYGPSRTWQPSVRAEVFAAQSIAQQRVSSWELAS